MKATGRSTPPAVTLVLGFCVWVLLAHKYADYKATDVLEALLEVLPHLERPRLKQVEAIEHGGEL